MTDPALTQTEQYKNITLRSRILAVLTPSNIVLACLLFFAAYLRFTGLGAEPFWMDEGYTMAYTDPPFFKMLNYIATRDVHPPLYYVLIKIWQQFSEGEVFLRLPSAISGVLTVWVLWALVKENWGTAAGLAAGFLLAVSEGAIWYSQEVRMYSLLLLFTALSMKYFLRFLSGSMERKDWIAMIPSTSALIYTHNVAVFLWVSQGLFCLALGCVLWIRRAYREEAVLTAWFSSFRTWFLSQVIITIIYLPWLFVVINQKVNMDNRFWLAAPGLESVRTVFVMALAYKSWGPLAASTVSLGILAAVIRGISGLRSTKIAGTLACLVLPLAMSYFYSIKATPMLVDRTLFFTVIPLFILIAAILPDFRNFFNKKIVCKWADLFRTAAGLVLVALFAFVNMGSWSAEQRNQTKEDFRSAAERCSGLVDANTAIVFSNAASQAAFDYYFHRYAGSENVLEIGLPVHYSLVPEGEANLEPLVTYESIQSLDTKLENIDIAVLVQTHQWYSDPNQMALRYFSERWGYLDNRSVGGIEILLFMR